MLVSHMTQYSADLDGFEHEFEGVWELGDEECDITTSRKRGKDSGKAGVLFRICGPFFHILQRAYQHFLSFSELSSLGLSMMCTPSLTCADSPFVVQA